MNKDDHPEQTDEDFADLWPCVGRTAISGGWEFYCQEVPSRHCHIRLYDEGLVAIIPARIESRPFLDAVIQGMKKQGHITAREVAAILASEAAGQLQTEITPEEKAVLDNPDSFERCLRHGYVGI